MQDLCLSTQGLQECMRLQSEPSGNLPGSLQADNRRIGCFLRRQVFAGAFAQRFGSLCYVQNIVYHLECQTQGPAKI